MLKPSHYTIGCDAHKHYSLFTLLDRNGELVDQIRVSITTQDEAGGEIAHYEWETVLPILQAELVLVVCRPNIV